MKRLITMGMIGVACAGLAGEASGRQNLGGQSEFLLDGWTFNGRPVTIPHDWAIGGPFDREIDKQVVRIVENQERKATEKTGRTGSLPWIGRGEYRRKLRYPKGAKNARLYFHGAMSEPEVFLDGEKIGEWMNGYAPFSVELKPFEGEKELVVKLNNRPSSSRWYPGAGLYRPVELRFDEEVRPEEVQVWTERIENGVACMRVKSPLGDRAFTVLNPRLWTPETPELYTLEPEGVRYGIRTVAYTAGGFLLNGVRRDFKGVCLHHDLGPLGAAFNQSAFRRQVRKLKEMGCDSLRTSHNIPAPWQLDICDEEGMMVMAESFDAWENAKVKNGYNLFFSDWWKCDLEALVRMARNHPSVVMWSIGNEVSEQAKPRGAELSRQLQAHIHAFDCDTNRLVTQGISWLPEAIESGVIGAMEIPAVTYRLDFYEAGRKANRSGIFLGAETASTVSSRGRYHFPVATGTMVKHEDGQSSGYDVEYCSWSNLPDDDFAMQDDHDWTIGEFVWTGFDYLGEPTPYDTYWPSRSSYFGIFDLAGLPKDRYWLYRSRWRKSSPTLHLLPHWNWPGREGEITPVCCYTSYPTVELFVNGVSQGRRTKDPASRLDRYRLRWNDVVYRPGELKAVAYDASGRRMEEGIVRTAGRPERLLVEAEADYTRPGDLTPGLRFVKVSLVDKAGTVCPDADRRLSFETEGGVRFHAVCNGDPTSLEVFGEPRMKTFGGSLVVIVEVKGAGELRIRSEDGLPEVGLHFE